MKSHKFMFLAFVFCAFGILVCTSCKDKEQNPNPTSQVPEVANESQGQDAEVTTESPKIDYGDDELGQALNTYQEQGYWFKGEKPKLIENRGTRIEYYKPFTDDEGKTWQFAKFARNFDINGEYAGKQWPVLFIYEGDKGDLRSAIETFAANYRKIEKDEDTRDNPRTFLPQSETQISGGVTVKDSYPSADMATHPEMYEGKKVFLFGFSYNTGSAEYMFDLK